MSSLFGMEPLPQIDLEGHPLVGVVSTFYEDPENIRYSIALQTVEAYASQAVPLIVVDASPEPMFADSFRERGAIVMDAPRPGLATQYIDGVAYAIEQGAGRVLRHEPEKVGMINFAHKISEALNLHDILVIGRSEKSLQSLPPTQAQNEKLAGRFLEAAANFPPDALSGGRAYTQRGAQYLADYDVELHGNNWLHLYYPVLKAIQKGVAVGGIQVDLMHPPGMKAEEEGNPLFDNKRDEQFIMQMVKLILYNAFQKAESDSL